MAAWVAMPLIWFPGIGDSYNELKTTLFIVISLIVFAVSCAESWIRIPVVRLDLLTRVMGTGLLLLLLVNLFLNRAGFEPAPWIEWVAWVMLVMACLQSIAADQQSFLRALLTANQWAAALVLACLIVVMFEGGKLPLHLFLVSRISQGSFWGSRSFCRWSISGRLSLKIHGI